MVSDVEQRLRPLMARAQAGDGDAWRDVLRALSTRLRPYFLRRLSADHAAEAEDLVQETLIAIHSRRATYDASLPVTAWAHAIARYKLIDFWRRRRVRHTLPLDDWADFLWVEDGGIADARGDLDRLLAVLPAKQEALVRAVRIEGLSLAEAGVRLGMSEGAAKVALHRAMKVLISKASA